jgi:hypothetical protein
MKDCETAWARIYMSGPIDVAMQIIRADCMRQGLCVTVTPTTYIYTGGEESGYVVGLNNYPRFPVTQIDLEARALDLMERLLAGTHQHSGMIQTPTKTMWHSQRKEAV